MPVIVTLFMLSPLSIKEGSEPTYIVSQIYSTAQIAAWDYWLLSGFPFQVFDVDLRSSLRKLSFFLFPLRFFSTSCLFGRQVHLFTPWCLASLITFLQFKGIWLITAHHRNCVKVKFSVLSVFPQGDPKPWPLPKRRLLVPAPPRHVWTCSECSPVIWMKCLSL